MKLLMVIPYLSERYGGTSKVVMELASSLSRLGQSVDIVTTTANDSGNLDVKTNDWTIQAGYRVRYFSTWHHNDCVVSGSMIAWLSRYIKEYDLVHTHTLFAPLVTISHSICRFFKVPYVTTPHGMLEPWALSNKAWKKRAYYQAFEHSSLANANAVQVLANSEASNVQALGIDQTVKVPNGICRSDFSNLGSPNAFYNAFPETRDKKLILFLGRLDPKKGLDLLAPAFAKARSLFPNAHLIVAGPDSINFMPTAQSYFSEEGCLDSVTFTGMLKGELKKSALASADIYVAPSYSEGFSMSVLEGMATGLPCVITAGCNFPEAATADAAHVVATNSQAIGDALLQCLKDKSQAKELGETARDFVLQNYTWEQSAKQLIRVYKSIVNCVNVSKLETIEA